MFRPKMIPERLRPAYAAFLAQAERVEAARTALLGCLPVGRVDPAPVPVGLDLVDDELREIGEQLGEWRVAEVERDWHAVAAAMAEARAAIPEAHRVAATTRELEELLAAVGEVVAPLDSWGTAELHWRGLRVRAARAPRS